MQHQVSQEDRHFLRQFADGEVKPVDFNHREHVRLAYICLALEPPTRAPVVFKEMLLTFVQRNGIDPVKFHETLTQAWMLAVAHFMARTAPQASANDFIQANPLLLDSKIMLTHYTEQTLYSQTARQQFVEPDLDPIPRHAGT